MQIKLRDVSQGYGRRTILSCFNLEMSSGIVGLVGSNGAGKTTLLRTIATVMPPRTGELEIAGKIIKGEGDARSARRHIGYLPQRFGAPGGIKLADFVRYAAWLRDVPSTEWDSAAHDALEAVELTDRRSTKMRSLSGGMRQRAGIAAAIVGRPSLVLLDEPTVGLDPGQRLQFRRLVKDLAPATVLLSTHLIDDVGAICDRVIVVDGGTLLFDGATHEMIELGTINAPGDTPLERAYMSLLAERAVA